MVIGLFLMYFFGMLCGALFTFYFISIDKTIIMLKPDETYIKKEALELLQKAYRHVKKNIDPDIDE